MYLCVYKLIHTLIYILVEDLASRKRRATKLKATKLSLFKDMERYRKIYDSLGMEEVMMCIVSAHFSAYISFFEILTKWKVVSGTEYEKYRVSAWYILCFLTTKNLHSTFEKDILIKSKKSYYTNACNQTHVHTGICPSNHFKIIQLLIEKI